MPGNFNRDNRETSLTSQGPFFELWEPPENAFGGGAGVHVNVESDESP
jgi:hypothetical protein